jgi:integrase/recombinase XerD
VLTVGAATVRAAICPKIGLRPPNTIKAYAHDLKDYQVFLAGQGLDWREVRLEDAGGLASPAPGRAGRAGGGAAVGDPARDRIDGEPEAVSTVGLLLPPGPLWRRFGWAAGDLAAAGPPGRRGGWKPFLHRVSKGKPQPRRVITVKAPGKLPRVLAVGALGLRHEDIAAAEREITIVPRVNGNRARCKLLAAELSAHELAAFGVHAAAGLGEDG